MNGYKAQEMHDLARMAVDSTSHAGHAVSLLRSMFPGLTLRMAVSLVNQNSGGRYNIGGGRYNIGGSGCWDEDAE